MVNGQYLESLDSIQQANTWNTLLTLLFYALVLACFAIVIKTRMNVRQHKSIQNDAGKDCILAVMCCPCAIAQAAREVGVDEPGFCMNTHDPAQPRGGQMAWENEDNVNTRFLKSVGRKKAATYGKFSLLLYNPNIILFTKTNIAKNLYILIVIKLKK